MDIWSLHTKAHALGHMGSMKIKSFLNIQIAKKRHPYVKISKWPEVYQHGGQIISTFTGVNFEIHHGCQYAKLDDCIRSIGSIGSIKLLIIVRNMSICASNDICI